MIGEARRRRTPLQALHVNHNLHPESKSWLRHCEAFCRVQGVAFEGHGIAVQIAPGVSPEAAAREARYEILGRTLQAGDALLTAHHQDDQLETFLLMALRGSGPAGLA